MQVNEQKPISREVARSIAKFLIRQAETEQANSTGPERLGDIAPKAADRIVNRSKHRDQGA